MTKEELIDILKDHPDLSAIGCVSCGGNIESLYKEWQEPRPYGSTVAMETCGETRNWCHECQSDNTAGPLLKEVLAFIMGEDSNYNIHTGHLLWLAEVMEQYGAEDVLYATEV